MTFAAEIPCGASHMPPHAVNTAMRVMLGLISMSASLSEFGLRLGEGDSFVMSVCFCSIVPIMKTSFIEISQESQCRACGWLAIEAALLVLLV